MTIWRNCDGVTRRDCLQLGLGALLGGGLTGALRSHGPSAGGGRQAAAGGQLYPDLDGRRADALRDVGPQAGCTGRDSRRIRGHPDEAAGSVFLAIPAAAGIAGRPDRRHPLDPP